MLAGFLTGKEQMLFVAGEKDSHGVEWLREGVYDEGAGFSCMGRYPLQTE